MKIEIWSDVICPWCYIGKRRFEKALEQSGQRENIRGDTAASNNQRWNFDSGYLPTTATGSNMSHYINGTPIIAFSTILSIV